MADSVVKIIVGAGHGSGVHIGDGYIISASHVSLCYAPHGRNMFLLCSGSQSVTSHSLGRTRTG